VNGVLHNRIAFTAAAAAMWAGFFAWAGWLVVCEARYQQDYVGHVAKLGGMDEYRLGTVVNWKEKRKVIFFGWSLPEPDFRWSSGRQATIGIRLSETPDKSGLYSLRMRLATTAGRQSIGASVNGVALGTIVAAGPSELWIPIPGSALVKGPNRFVFQFPGAVRPGTGDVRELAIALKDVTLLEGGPRTQIP